MSFLLDRFLLLPIGAVIALLWANLAPESYFTFTTASSFAVNDVAMALFLALVAQEVLEALMPGGALSHWRQWGLAVAAGIGGYLGAAGMFVLYVQLSHETVLTAAWPVACAVDMAAGYYVLKTVWRRGNALPLVLLIAMVADGIGLIVVAVQAPDVNLRWQGLILVFAAVALATVLRLRLVARLWPYLIVCGALSWWGLYLVGVQPALALMPIIPFLPREPRPKDIFEEPADDDPVHRDEHEWSRVVQVVLFFFGLVNAGVIVTDHDTGSWAILAAGLVGRPVGILLFVWLATVAGLALPKRIRWRELVVIAFATTSGFTFALLFAASTLPVGAVLSQIKFGALATAVGVPLTIGVARLLGVGRFARR